MTDPVQLSPDTLRRRFPKVRCRAIEAASGLMRAMANPVRLAILCVLTEGERSVAELEAILGVHQPTLSQQISDLRRSGIIKDRRAARSVYYRLSEPRAGQIIGHLRMLFAEPDASSIWRGAAPDSVAAEMIS